MPSSGYWMLQNKRPFTRVELPNRGIVKAGGAEVVWGELPV